MIYRITLTLKRRTKKDDLLFEKIKGLIKEQAYTSDYKKLSLGRYLALYCNGDKQHENIQLQIFNASKFLEVNNLRECDYAKFKEKADYFLQKYNLTLNNFYLTRISYTLDISVLEEEKNNFLMDIIDSNFSFSDTETKITSLNSEVEGIAFINRSQNYKLYIYDKNVKYRKELFKIDEEAGKHNDIITCDVLIKNSGIYNYAYEHDLTKTLESFWNKKVSEYFFKLAKLDEILTKISNNNMKVEVN